MSERQHHGEWLSLVEISGPFLSLVALERAFPQGLDARDVDSANRLRLAHAEWAASVGRDDHPAYHAEWARFVLDDVLEFPADLLDTADEVSGDLTYEAAEQGETVRPDYVLRGRDGGARLLVQVWPQSQDLEDPVEESGWAANPLDRATLLCRAVDVSLALVTNGERWTLVHATAAQTASYASWYATVWSDEPLTLRAFRSLLGTRRFFGVADDDTLEALLEESADYQEEVTDKLGAQVRRAVEVLVQALDKADADSGRELLADVDPDRLYEAALTIMMRLVFLFSAEERGLLLMGDSTYDQNYAVSTLGAQLREEADEVGIEVLERRQDAWSRLLATFRAIYGGVEHESLHIPPYGGSLFDPDRFPFLEGRSEGSSWRETGAQPLPVDNRTILHLLDALQFLQGATKNEPARRLSFRALDIEQIGHVYEGLLDHTVVRAEGPGLGLVGRRGDEPELGLNQLEEAHEQGEDALIDLLAEETQKSESALRSLLEDTPEATWLARLRTACAGEEGLFERVRPYQALIRSDPWEEPIVYRTGAVFVTMRPGQRPTGTHYTPRVLTEEIVGHTLDPLAYQGPTESKDPSTWTLRKPSQLLNLKVCDPAMGSGAFLVQSCRYLADRLLESWEQYGVDDTLKSVEMLPASQEERRTLAMRLVSERCLYGVDINPLAVELAKLSLWLVTLARNRPFGFLDHALKCGDSLLGVADLSQLKRYSLSPGTESLQADWEDPSAAIETSVETATKLREKIESFAVLDVHQAQDKARLNRKADAQLARLCTIGNLLSGVAISATVGSGSAGSRADDRLKATWNGVRAMLRDSHEQPDASLAAKAAEWLNAGKPALMPDRKPFHWVIEFPEVFTSSRSGFDAFVMNPPFLGSQRTTAQLGDDYREYCIAHIANGRRGIADLSAYFLLRAARLVRSGGTLGTLATNTIAQGETRHVGLDQMSDWTIIRAIRSRPWPGAAHLEIAQLWMFKGSWDASTVLDGEDVAAVTSELAPALATEHKPQRIPANADKSFIGMYVRGLGFVLEQEEAVALMEEDPTREKIIYPYLNGRDLYSSPDQSATRYVIFFGDMSLEKAAEYPKLLQLVRERVKPQRDELGRDNERWWQFERTRPALRAAVAGMDRILVRAQVSSTWAFAYVPPGQVFDSKLIVFALPQFEAFGALQSYLHWEWSLRFGTTLRNDLSYSPRSCFDTYPLLEVMGNSTVAEIAEELHEYRRAFAVRKQLGLTKIFGEINNPESDTEEVRRLRALQLALDQAVVTAFGWHDVTVEHCFVRDGDNTRYTIRTDITHDLLGRLVRLNNRIVAKAVEDGTNGR